MDFEKAYRDALERAKLSRLQLLDIGEEATEIEYIFPELKESEDEKIRKEMIDFLQETIDNVGESPNKWTMYNAKKWIAWLEKQGKQNSADSYCEEHCKGFQETGKCFADGECKAKRDAERNHAWSEEDELMFTSTINSLKLTNGTCDMKIDWLKSLKNRVQPHWKPTDKQLSVLQTVIKDYGICAEKNVLESLYNDLKKL